MQRGGRCCHGDFYGYGVSGSTQSGLCKILSGLGSMYDTALFPSQPCGILGAGLLRQCGCIPWAITPNQCWNGVIHTLI
ncbi:MAG TPA: hypothetical protein DGX96_03120 [Lachnospiraceae bacterium]|nr:hypothetical protein [Lachnospiraceae bacterium]